MKENFDNKFSQKVKEVFENRQEPYNPEDWEKLKAKKDKHKDRFLFWLFGKSAAVILLFIIIGGTGGVVLYNMLQNTTTPINNEGEIIIGNTNSNKNTKDSITPDSLRNPIHNSYKRNIENTINESKNNITKTDGKNDIKNNGKVDDISNKRNLNNLNQIIKKRKVNESNTIVSIQQKNNNQDKKLLSEQTTNSSVEKDSVDAQINKAKIAVIEQESSESLKNLQNIDSLTSTDKLLIADSNKSIRLDSLPKKDINLVLEEIPRGKSKNNSVTFGVAVSPIINYDQANQSPNIGFGGGVLLEIPFFKNFDIYTGLLVTNQKINFQENTLLEIASGIQLKSKEAVLTGLDIPINLKYNFVMNKNKMFVAAGLSSVTFLKENVESTFQVSNTVLIETVDNFGNPIILSNVENTFEKETETLGSFNNFHFGKIINLSFGVELPFKKKRQSLIIEPYFKYSLGSLTSEQINFSSGGINLKLNFNKKK